MPRMLFNKARKVSWKLWKFQYFNWEFTKILRKIHHNSWTLIFLIKKCNRWLYYRGGTVQGSKAGKVHFTGTFAFSSARTWFTSRCVMFRINLYILRKFKALKSDDNHQILRSLNFLKRKLEKAREILEYVFLLFRVEKSRTFVFTHSRIERKIRK